MERNRTWATLKMESACSSREYKRLFARLLAGGASLLFGFMVLAQGTNIYYAGFEPSEGFDTRLTLVGQGCATDNQMCWVGTDTNGSGNGIVANYFDNTNSMLQPFGQQQAFVGFYPLTDTNGILNVWRPLNFDPLAAGLSVVTFSTTLAIYDSVATTNRDCFRWSIYNMEADPSRLFTLDFDNTTTGINYELDDGIFVPTGFSFERGGEYDLTIILNFADNLWSATLRGSETTATPIVDSQPMSTQGSVLNLGDIDAVWVNRDIGVYGDNFMVFDNYSVAAEPYPVSLEVLEPGSNGAFRLALIGEPGRRYSIDVTSDFVDWFALATNNAGTDGGFDFVDTTSTGYTHSFYRARWVE